MCGRYGATGGNAASDKGAVTEVSCASSRFICLRVVTCPKVVDMATEPLRARWS
ncbi:WD repeat domain-containing protein [Colletotrichum musicola]|uniref:WD repeat domain-containing protein n=2 Tax=Colletotrichum orchidearum species complex TaxID=2707337 RepID=A0A8H6U784_9PEZI|nr:WD repeat domain-containing protein [Colletotrichum sojae]KAF6842676.1 WD repeat domain-containing protein [Colletotrichum musicola]